MKASERAPAASVPSKEHLSSSLLAARIAYLFATRSPHKRRGLINRFAARALFRIVRMLAKPGAFVKQRNRAKKQWQISKKSASEESYEKRKSLFFACYLQARPQQKSARCRAEVRAFRQGPLAQACSAACTLTTAPGKKPHNAVAQAPGTSACQLATGISTILSGLSPVLVRHVRWSVCLSLPFPNRCR